MLPPTEGLALQHTHVVELLVLVAVVILCFSFCFAAAVAAFVCVALHRSVPPGTAVGAY